MDSLDWASYALPWKPGRVFSTYLAQSKWEAIYPKKKLNVKTSPLVVVKRGIKVAMVGNINNTKYCWEYFWILFFCFLSIVFIFNLLMTFDHCSKAAPECENLRSEIFISTARSFLELSSKCFVICPLNMKIYFSVLNNTICISIIFRGDIYEPRKFNSFIVRECFVLLTFF